MAWGCVGRMTKLCKIDLGKKQSAGFLSVTVSTITDLNAIEQLDQIVMKKNAHQANPNCGSCFRKHSLKFLQITSLN